MSIAFMFPGQGAQQVGMGHAFYTEFAAARQVFAAADEALGLPLSTLCFEGPDEALLATEIQQPAILTTSVAIWAVLDELGLRPTRVAGLSLGEYSALVAAGALDFADAVRLVRDRGRYMQAAVPPGEGAMAAILGLAKEDVAAACRHAAAAHQTTVQPANYNSPGQIVIAGTRSGVEAAAAACKAMGARRAVLLPVSAPFHCPLMAPAARQLARRLADVPFADATVPVVCNVDAQARTRAAEFPGTLVAQVEQPVLWEDCMAAMLAAGCDVFVEIGPGRTLSGFMRRMNAGSRCTAVADPAGLEELLACVREVC